jgi:hypothetical protein
MEVDQTRQGAVSAYMGAGIRLIDRWMNDRSTPMAVITCQQIPSLISLPGTNFTISNNYLKLNLGVQQTTLAVNDYWAFRQNVEGPNLRELLGDVTSFSMLCLSSVAVKFGIAIRDSAFVRSLTKLVSLPASTWTLIQFPNLPLWASGGTYNLASGTLGYSLDIVLACGTQFTSPANDTWQTGNFLGAVGQDNFAAKPVNSFMQFAFLQHEPGPYCTQFIDLPFPKNFSACQRYAAKSNAYATACPTANDWEMIGQFPGTGSNYARGHIQFPATMAKTPTATLYDNTTTANAIYLDTLGSIAATAANVSTSNIGSISFSAAATATSGTAVLGQWLADTGW